MRKINSRSIIISIILSSISIMIMTCKKDNSDCTDNKYYLTFLTNEQKICNSLCTAGIMDSLKQYPSTIYFSNIITGIASGQQSVINDSIYYNYMLTINFPGKTIGYFNKDSVKGIDYSVDLKINNQYYSFPSYEFDTSDILKIKGNFELNINVYDLERHIISGTFKGILYNSDYIYQKDSVIITNGEFKSELKYK